VIQALEFSFCPLVAEKKQAFQLAVVVFFVVHLGGSRSHLGWLVSSMWQRTKKPLAPHSSVIEDYVCIFFLLKVKT